MRPFYTFFQLSDHHTLISTELLYKLSCYGVCDMVLDWLKDFLCARMQCVKIESSLSRYCAVTSVVPQGVFWDLYYLYCLSMIL